MIGYIYRITILNKESSLHGFNYIGLHMSPEFDSKYYGSGRIIKDYRKKYGKNGLHKELLDFSNDIVELQNLEIYYINMEHGNYFNMNIQLGGRLGNKGVTYRKGYSLPLSVRQKISKTKKNNPYVMSNEKRKQLSIKMTGSKNHMYGVNVKDRMTQEDYERMLLKRSSSMKGKLAMEKNPMFNHDINNDKILEMYNNGMSIKDIAKECNCNYHLIYDRLSSITKIKKKTIDKNKVLEMHNNGKTRKEISDILGCTPSRVGQIIKELKI